MDRSTFVVAHPHSSFFLKHWADPSQNEQFENVAKFGVFSLLLGDRIYQFI